MVIEPVFGVLKARFLILNLMPKFKQSRQRYVIVMCCAVHNFIRINNRGDKLFTTLGDDTQSEGGESNSEGNGNGNTGASIRLATQKHVMEMLDETKKCMAQFRDDIIDAIWADYVTHGH